MRSHALLFLLFAIVNLSAGLEGPKPICQNLYQYACPPEMSASWFVEHVKDNLLNDVVTAMLASNPNDTLVDVILEKSLDASVDDFIREKGNHYGEEAAVRSVSSELFIFDDRYSSKLYIHNRTSVNATQFSCKLIECPLFFQRIVQGYRNAVDVERYPWFPEDCEIVSRGLVVPNFSDSWFNERLLRNLLTNKKHPFHFYLQMLMMEMAEPSNYYKDHSGLLRSTQLAKEAILTTIKPLIPHWQYRVIEHLVAPIDVSSWPNHGERYFALRTYLDTMHETVREATLDSKNKTENLVNLVNSFKLGTRRFRAAQAFAVEHYYPDDVKFIFYLLNSSSSVFDFDRVDLAAEYPGFYYSALDQAFRKFEMPLGFRHGFLATAVAKKIVDEVNNGHLEPFRSYITLEDESPQEVNSELKGNATNLIEELEERHSSSASSVEQSASSKSTHSTGDSLLPLCEAEITQIIFKAFENARKKADAAVPRGRRYASFVSQSTLSDREWFFVGLATRHCTTDPSKQARSILSLERVSHQMGAFNRLFQCNFDGAGGGLQKEENECGSLLSSTFLN